VAIALVAAIALSIGLVPSLLRSVNDRTASNTVSTLKDMAQRVRVHPHDVAARLDYGHALLDSGAFGDAFRQFTAALAIQPDNVDALANYGLLVHLSGRSLAGLDAENRALKIDPTYGEALFYKGTILLKGLDRPAPAIVFLQRYLDGNPTGSYGATARSEISTAHGELENGTPTPTPTPTPSPPVPSPRLTVPSA
jgi:tetratricopeptide (TPR) repeat protein